MMTPLQLPAMNAGQIERLWEIEREISDSLRRLKQKVGATSDGGPWDFEDRAFWVTVDAMFADVAIGESCRADIYRIPDFRRSHILKLRRAQLYRAFLWERDGVRPTSLTDADIDEAKRLWYIDAGERWLVPDRGVPECRVAEPEDLF
jgi:hypothetical protein